MTGPNTSREPWRGKKAELVIDRYLRRTAVVEPGETQAAGGYVEPAVHEESEETPLRASGLALLPSG